MERGQHAPARLRRHPSRGPRQAHPRGAGRTVADQSLGSARPHRREEPAARHGRRWTQALSRRLGDTERRGAAVRHHGLRRPPRARARLPRQARPPGAGGDGLLHGRHAHRGAGGAPAAARGRPCPAGGALGFSCRPDRPRLPGVGRAVAGPSGRQGGRTAGRHPADVVLVARSLACREEVRPFPRHGPGGRRRPRVRAAGGLAERRRAAGRSGRA